MGLFLLFLLNKRLFLLLFFIELDDGSSSLCFFFGFDFAFFNILLDFHCLLKFKSLSLDHFVPHLGVMMIVHIWWLIFSDIISISGMWVKWKENILSIFETFTEGMWSGTIVFKLNILSVFIFFIVEAVLDNTIIFQLNKVFTWIVNNGLDFSLFSFLGKLEWTFNWIRLWQINWIKTSWHIFGVHFMIKSCLNKFEWLFLFFLCIFIFPFLSGFLLILDELNLNQSIWIKTSWHVFCIVFMVF